MYKKLLLYSILLFCFWQPLEAQVVPVKKDSTKVKRDSTAVVFQNIENYSKRRKFTRFLHRLIFRPTDKKSDVKKNKAPNYSANFTGYQGKIIRKISINTLDPFGFDIDGSERNPKMWAERQGNLIHLKTKHWTVRNQILFKKNDRLDSLLLKESVRLIQQQRYIRKVAIRPIPLANSKDSVDIEITVLDSWSLIPSGSLSSTHSTLEITERNFFGLGHEFQNIFKQRFSDNKNAYEMRYTIPNFKNTFIRTTILYDKEYNNDYIKSIGFNRPFFSPYTRWAGGIAFEERFYRDSIKAINRIPIYTDFKSESEDLWSGYAMRIFKKTRQEKHITNLVTTARFRNLKYIESPDKVYDSISYFSNSRLYLASLGVTSRQYIADKFLFNYGIPEYVQIGKTYSITGGIEDKNNIQRVYFGGRYSVGGYYSFGFFSASFELGSFFNDGNTEQTTFNAEINYFTRLYEWGNWKFRQFIKPRFTIGNNRLATDADLLNLGGNSGIEGFNLSAKGSKKMLITFQTQSYVPGQWYGFRLSPFYNMEFGMLSSSTETLLQNKLYSKFGIGFIISNDYMVFNNFILSFAYYPTIPGGGDHIFKSNAYKNNNIELPDFQIGRPEIVPYQ
ncbi:MAG TPA: hypothetical protein VLB74_00900 [Flavobacterium sp.]|uniref:hypothetical protein n=1 Tax=Flavobacterium sp. TaxID=239 RepID=UPI002C24230B|nr:hypothetical protein [Flavobacterium sp.]HSD13183.1 hypothetical protein [Flavobacterium sp.]